MRRKWTGFVVCMLAAASMWMFGCQKTEVPQAVLAERTESSSGSENGGGKEEAAENPESQDSLYQEKTTIRAKTEAPDRYQTEVLTDKLDLQADAVLKIPETEEIPVMTVVKKPYTKEEYQHIRQVFSDLWGIEWGDEKTEIGHNAAKEQGSGVYDVNGDYYLSFWTGKEEGTAPIIWLNRASIYAGRSLNAFSEEDEEKKARSAWKEKSEEFMEKLGMDGMALSDIRWVEISKNDGTEPGICFLYRRTCSQIPILGSCDAALGNSPKSGTQYFRFTYTMKGEPVEIKGISREDYERTGSEDEFLLPFAAIAQIFEQHCRVYDGQEESSLFDVGTGNRQEQGTGLEGISPYQRIRVARVALEYRYAGEDYGEGTIFPVWSFYGSAEKGYRRPAGTEAEILNAEIPEAAMSAKNGEEVLLVSIGARDGVIY